MTTIVTIEPGALDRSAAARFIALSESTLETLSRTEILLKPVQISKGRVAWPVANLRQYILTRPVADLPPPRGCGYGRAGKVGENTEGQRLVEPACPVCNRTPVFEHDRRVNEWAGHCKHCAVEGPVAATEEEARRLWIVWHHKRSDAQIVLVNAERKCAPGVIENLTDLHRVI